MLWTFCRFLLSAMRVLCAGALEERATAVPCTRPGARELRGPIGSGERTKHDRRRTKVKRLWPMRAAIRFPGCGIKPMEEEDESERRAEGRARDDETGVRADSRSGRGAEGVEDSGSWTRQAPARAKSAGARPPEGRDRHYFSGKCREDRFSASGMPRCAPAPAARCARSASQRRRRERSVRPRRLRARGRGRCRGTRRSRRDPIAREGRLSLR